MRAGMVIINKEKGDTSQTVVTKVKKKLQVKKAGHIGTLDPLATGVLPILIEEATKLSQYFIEHDKTYRAVLQLGIQTDTGDEEGKIVKQAEVGFLEEEKVGAVLKQMEGKQKQIPPQYSAVKVKGKKLYEYARQGEKVEIPAREIEIYAMELIKLDKEEKQICFDVSCSKGTYIRVLCEDMAKKLGTVGYMKDLQRTKVDEFSIQNAVFLENLQENNVISVEEICKNYEKLELDQRKLGLFLNGVMLTVSVGEGMYRIYCQQRFIGLGIVKNKLLKRDMVIKEREVAKNVE